MRIDSLGDLNFMGDGSAVGLSAVDRAGFSHRPEPKTTSAQATSADGDQRPTGPVSKGQRPRVRVQKASVKRASTLQQPASLRAVNWRGKAIANEKPLGPSVAPVVLFFGLGRVFVGMEMDGDIPKRTTPVD